MRLLFLFLPLLLVSCAYQGVIVEKNTRPFPLYESVGVEEMSSIELRDSSGAVHRQMVTPEVYQRYARGDYFNDQQPGPAQGEAYPSEDPGVTARPIQPIAGGARGLSGQGLTAVSRSATKSLASSGGGKKTSVAAHRNSTVRRPMVASHSPASSHHSTTKTVAVNRSTISAPASLRSVPAPATPPSVTTNANNEVAVASMAHFSAEVTSRGVISATLNSTPEPAAVNATHSNKKTVATHSVSHRAKTKHPHKPASENE